MASTYSTSLRIELIGNGEQSGTWGTTTNTNLGSIIEQAITGVETITMADATYTLSNYNGAIDQARNAVLVLNGPVTTPQNLVAPAVEKVYLIKNQTGSTITIKTSSGNGAALSNGTYAQVYCDGADFYNATPSGNSVTGNLAVSGSITAGANVTANGTITANTISATTYTGITGRIIQTVFSSGGTGSTTSGSFTATSSLANITPTSVSSKILVLVSGMFWQTNGYGGNAFLTVYRNSTNLNSSSPMAMAAVPTGQNSFYGSTGISLLDSPSSTSLLTYRPYISADSGGTADWGAYSSARITLLEIL